MTHTREQIQDMLASLRYTISGLSDQDKTWHRSAFIAKYFNELQSLLQSALETQPVDIEALDAFDTLLEFVNDEVSGHATRLECIEKIRKALNRPAVPEGYALVPIEPTAEMMSIGKQATNPFFATGAGLPTDNFPMHAIYKGMIAAAPKQGD